MPNSVIWVGLVATWLFVLLPMMVSNRPRIGRTSDVALATRVLHRGGITKPKRGPATGHRSDPQWLPEHDDRVSMPAHEIFADRPHSNIHADIHADIHAEDPMETHVDTDQQPERERENDDRGAGFVPSRRGRGGFDPQADAIARAERYSFRQRMVLGLVFVAIIAAAIAVIVLPTVWWLCGITIAGIIGYLAYLRRQVRIEQEVRQRRLTRMSRSRLGVESLTDDELRLVPQRLRRPGAVVLEVDDEDPAFEHLYHYDAPFQEQHLDDEEHRPHMRRASGS